MIEGGVPLRGTVVPAGNKNGALPILAACLLTEEEVTLRNVPRISDVDAMLGAARVARRDGDLDRGGEMSVNAADVDHTQRRPRTRRTDPCLLPACRTAARTIWAVPTMPPPGGDVIGRSRLDPHFDAMRALGATVEHGRDIEITAPSGGLRALRLPDGRALRDGDRERAAGGLVDTGHDHDPQRRLRAACAGSGPHAGGDGRRDQRHRLQRHARTRADRLHGCTHTIAPDHIEIGSFMALAGVTGGELIVKDTVPEDLRMIRLVFARIGLESHVDGSDVIVPGNQRLTMKTDAGGHTPKIQDGPWPAFPADLTSVALALATQAEGSVIVHEWMFESRLVFTDKLQLMGAAITICDPHRAIIVGPRRLRGQRVESPDIRAGMAMLIAALCAEGTTEIGNVGQIDRGYERIDERLRELGARIERVEDNTARA